MSLCFFLTASTLSDILSIIARISSTCNQKIKVPVMNSQEKILKQTFTFV